MRGGSWVGWFVLVGCGPSLLSGEGEGEGSASTSGSTSMTSADPSVTGPGDGDDDDRGSDDAFDDSYSGPDFFHPGKDDDPSDDTKPESFDCSLLDPSRVYIAGVVWGQPAIGDVAAQSGSCVGFEFGVNHPTVNADGTLLFTEGQDGDVLRFVQDDWWWDDLDSGWRYPSFPEDNDEVVPRPGCPRGEPLSFVVRPSDGAVVYECLDGIHRDEFGQVVVDRPGQLLSIAPDDRILFADASTNTGIYAYDLVVLSDGEPLPVGVPPGFGFEDASVLIWRQHADGWWIVLEVESTYHLFYLDELSADYEGEYPPTPPGLQPFGSGKLANALDGEGRLYQTAYDAGAATFDSVYVLYRTLGGRPTQVLDDNQSPALSNVVPVHESLFSGE